MIDFNNHFPPMNARTHEVCGASALFFAFSLAGRLGGTTIWVRESWRSEQINPSGFAQYFDPQNLLVAQARNQTDVLAVGEESLRGKSVSLVVMELDQDISLTQGRRLQLAAQAGNTTGLCIIPDGMGSNAAQTRWRCSPIFDETGGVADSTLQNWSIIKNKSGTLTAWNVNWDAKTRRINVVSPTAQR